MGKFIRIAFYIVAGLASAMIVLAFLPMYPLVVINWLPLEWFLKLRPELVEYGPGVELHRLHGECFIMLVWGLALGLLFQLHRPECKVGAWWLLTTVAFSMLAGAAMTGTFSAPGEAPLVVIPVLLGVLHPAGTGLFRWQGFDPKMLALAVLTAVPWVFFAVGADKVIEVDPRDIEFGHHVSMTSIGLLAAILGALGATRMPAWRIPAWGAVFVSANIALMSLVYPGLLSGLAGPWPWLALAWSIMYATLITRRS